ncbi:MAG: tetratricopeptide repeat protein, partial [Myxococcota bacterium]
WRCQASEQALPWYHRAAEQALEAEDLNAVLAYAERALDCGAQGETRGALRRLQAETHNWRGDHGEAQQCGREALKLLPANSDAWGDAAHHQIFACGNLAAYDEVEAVCDRLLASIDRPSQWRHLFALTWSVAHLAAGGRGDRAYQLRDSLDQVTEMGEIPKSLIAALADVDAFLASMSGKPDRAVALFRRASRHWTAVGNARNACLSQSNAGDDLVRLGQYGEAESNQRELLEMSERLGADYLLGDIKTNLARALNGLGRADEAESILREVLAGDAPPFQRLWAMVNLCEVLYTKANYGEALAETHRAAQAAEGQPRHEAHIFAVRARTLLVLERDNEALSVTRLSMLLLNDHGVAVEDDALPRLAHAEALYACGEHAEARRALKAAEDRLLTRAKQIQNPQWQASFLGNVAENRRTLELSKAWGLPDLER